MSSAKELAMAVAGLGSRPPVELADGVLLIEHELPEIPRIVLIADRTAPHMRQALEREVLRSGELESPWARADREAASQRERLLDSIANEKAFRPMPIPRVPAPKPFKEYRVVDSAAKRARRKANKAAKAARRATRGRR